MRSCHTCCHSTSPSPPSPLEPQALTPCVAGPKAQQHHHHRFPPQHTLHPQQPSQACHTTTTKTNRPTPSQPPSHRPKFPPSHRPTTISTHSHLLPTVLANQLGPHPSHHRHRHDRPIFRPAPAPSSFVPSPLPKVCHVSPVWATPLLTHGACISLVV